MRKIAILLGCAIMVLMALPMVALAQDGTTGTELTGLQAYFASLAALLPLVVLITGFIKKAIKVDGILAQVISWIISIGLCYAGWLLKIGLFAEITTWWLVLIYGFAVGLAANGFFKIELIQTILNVIGLKPKPSPKLK